MALQEYGLKKSLLFHLIERPTKKPFLTGIIFMNTWTGQIRKLKVCGVFFQKVESCFSHNFFLSVFAKLNAPGCPHSAENRYLSENESEDYGYVSMKPPPRAQRTQSVEVYCEIINLRRSPQTPCIRLSDPSPSRVGG